MRELYPVGTKVLHKYYGPGRVTGHIDNPAQCIITLKNGGAIKATLETFLEWFKIVEELPDTKKPRQQHFETVRGFARQPLAVSPTKKAARVKPPSKPVAPRATAQPVSAPKPKPAGRAAPITTPKKPSQPATTTKPKKPVAHPPKVAEQPGQTEPVVRRKPSPPPQPPVRRLTAVPPSSRAKETGSIDANKAQLRALEARLREKAKKKPRR
jgi:hypothetical protein